MKRIISLLSAVTMIITLTTVLSITSCQKEGRNQSATSTEYNDELASRAAPLKVDLAVAYPHVEDAMGGLPVGDATKLFNKRGHVAIMAPDGNPVTLGEYNMISGWANVKCINAGTHVVMHLKGLIPNGVYTIWTPIFQSPGSATPGNQIGFGALGAIEGSNNSNSFMADDEGNASISVIRAAGNLLTDGSATAFGSTPNCLADVYETHLALAYHLDGMVAAPGAVNTWVVQGVFKIWGSQLQ